MPHSPAPTRHPHRTRPCNAQSKPPTHLHPHRHPTQPHPPASPSPHLRPSSQPPAPTIPSPPPPLFLPPLTIHLCTHLPPSTPIPPLRTRIHPLFSRSSFPSLSPEAYALLLPALRLASHLLLSKRSLQWWCTTLLSPCSIPPPKLPSTIPPVLRPVSPTPHNLALTALALRTHASHLTFHFQPLTGGYGFTYRDHGGKVHIALSTAFLDFLLSGTEAVAPLAQKLRFRLLLAVSVLHEVAHGVWMLRVASEGVGFRGGGGEPLHGLGEVEAELGRSWERGVFGGRVQSVGFGVGCEEGLVWVGGEEGMVRFWGVGMGWVGGFCRGRGDEEGERMLVGEGVRVPFSEEGWARRGV